MKLVKIQKYFNIFTNLQFAIIILILLAIASSLGSFIEQDENENFYIENYPIIKPIYGFITSKFILQLGIDHVYRTWWFLSLLIILGICLISCTITRQFPIFLSSKSYFFKTKKKSFLNLPLFVKFQDIYYLKESIILKIQEMNFYIYQTNNIVYGYKGLIGRISPILVHLSLIIILGGSAFGAFNNFKAQEILPKGELFHVQNFIKVGWFTKIPSISIRVNDFWVEYQKKKVHQFYSNISILDSYGNEIKNKTISVNNPLRYKTIDFYQSDWNIIGIRVQNKNNIIEYPVFPLKKDTKTWITWIKQENTNLTLIFDQLENSFLIYNEKGEFIENKIVGDSISNSIKIIEIIPSSGLLIKYDPSIPIIYLGFGLLMITSTLSYLPYTQIWIVKNKKKHEKIKNIFIGGTTNRGKIQLEIEFENLIRYLERNLKTNNIVNN